MEIEMEYVESSWIEYIGYDEPSLTLKIQFKDGAVFEYYDFPESEWQDFESSDSKGKFFHKRIMRQYNESQVG